ncbi:TA system VapC family ribonuclease toxin [Microbacterium rhizophilus]|uniref:TA system VapC family ribonuclease toxin n=1 Tax=Microbacterium rhizophilus TaxID=3138934 RepID=UPI0031EEDEAA
MNILVHAFREDAPDHTACDSWIRSTLRSDRVGVADTILSGFVRVVTNARIFSAPAPTADALAYARWLLDAPTSTWLHQGAETWDRLETLASADSGIRGNLVPDAHIAALCLANGATLATRDRGFARFDGLRFFDPASSAS